MIAELKCLDAQLKRTNTTQVTASEMIGVSPVTLCRWLRGDHEPTCKAVIDKIGSVAKCLASKNGVYAQRRGV